MYRGEWEASSVRIRGKSGGPRLSAQTLADASPSGSVVLFFTQGVLLNP